MERKGGAIITTVSGEADGIKNSLFLAAKIGGEEFSDTLVHIHSLRVTLRALKAHARLGYTNERPPLKLHAREVEIAKLAVGFVRSHPEAIYDFYDRLASSRIVEATKFPSRDKTMPDLETQVGNILRVCEGDRSTILENALIAQEGFQSLDTN